ncbi:MAG: hypothetical protein EKK52_20820 [Burkholderiales bacterium]|uniref:hypothetical protein n=1 Tax=Roseateles sp. TaxID=1971397 RepID=UPI000FB21993|nr:MAG: hypothetical protein EKK52_20820 [Burkholderiales bacterium]
MIRIAFLLALVSCLSGCVTMVTAENADSLTVDQLCRSYHAVYLVPTDSARQAERELTKRGYLAQCIQQNANMQAAALAIAAQPRPQAQFTPIQLQPVQAVQPVVPLQPSTTGGFLAFHTGRSKVGTSVSGQLAIDCEYNLNGRTFVKTIAGAVCPSTINVY